ncbi:hypothetical protein [Blastococcus mobilis]|uniref:Uncharacterized protein n=1 Tax=Blastococcus mobilis TaxID=1938746 RepID=A0A238VET0_9ACTN|nr:hypothetical protein [Blastococcus mobilis]SNR32912.1 hypothetical protein SAMN06272737_10367 [Blastococcus mobilis]
MSAGISLWTRQPSTVEALQLVELRDLHAAELWLRGHGLESAHRHPALAGRGLLVPAGPGGIFTIAKLGQWLTRDRVTGDFAVPDDRTFRRVHTPLPHDELTALVDATQ